MQLSNSTLIERNIASHNNKNVEESFLQKVTNYLNNSAYTELEIEAMKLKESVESEMKKTHVEKYEHNDSGVNNIDEDFNSSDTSFASCVDILSEEENN